MSIDVDIRENERDRGDDGLVKKKNNRSYSILPMEQKATPKQLYEAPTIKVMELKTESVILAGSKPDYIPEEW